MIVHIHYDAEADVLLVKIRDVPPSDAVEEPGGVVISYGADGDPVSVEFLNASKRSLVEPENLHVTVHAA